MKKLFLIVTLLSSFFLAKSQAPNIVYLYGSTTSPLNRVQARNDFQVMRIIYPGLIDTTLTPTQNGAIVTRLSDGQTYNFISNPGGKQWFSLTAQDTLFAKRGAGAVGKFFVLGNPSRIDSLVYFNGGNTNPFVWDSLGGTSGLYFKKLPFKSSILGTDSALYRDSSGKVFVTVAPSGVTNLSSVATAISDSIKSSTGMAAVIGLGTTSLAGLLGPNGFTSLSNPLAFANYRGVGDTIATAAPFNDSLYFKAISPGELMAANTVTQQHIVINCDSNKIKALIGYGGGTTIYSGNGSLAGDRVLSGASHALSLGSSGSPLSTLLITVSSFSNGITINGGQLIVNSNILANHFISQGTPSIAIGVGDPGASVSISGTDEDGKITLTTGTSNFGFNVIATITFANSITNSFPVLFPNSSTAALLTGVTQVSTSGTGTTWSIFSGTTALAPSTTYIWYYHVGGF